MEVKYLAREDQPKELLTYLGVSRRSAGWHCILSCFAEISNGCAPGTEMYERVALRHGKTVAQVIRGSLCALAKARQKKPREWEEILPNLDTDISRAGLTAFLRCTAEWLDRNEIASFYLGHVKYRLPLQ